MKTEKIVFVALELTMILSMSWVATTGFQTVKTGISDEISSFQNIIYLMVIILSFFTVYHHNKRSAFLFSLFLSIFLTLLTTQRSIWQSPITVFFLASMLGVLDVILTPEARGNKFAVFLMIIVLPLILSESRMLGSVTTREMETPFYQVYLTSLVLVGGYLYLRHVTRIKIMERELLAKGADAQELTIVSWRSNIFAIAVITSAMGLNAVIGEIVIALTNQLAYHQNGFFVFWLIFAWIVGAAILTFIYTLSEKL